MGDDFRKYLSENGLTDSKWVKCFQDEEITKQSQIQAAKGDKELYQKLSSKANEEEAVALRKIFNISEPSMPSDSIEMELGNAGLPSHWLKTLDKQLGVKSPQPMKCIGSESYADLVRFAKKHFERKALRKLLEIDVEEISFKLVRDLQREKLRKRQDHSMKCIEVLKRCENEKKDRNNGVVIKKEQDICEWVHTHRETWLPKDASLSQIIGKLEAYQSSIDSSLKSKEVSEMLLIETASSGIALYGFLVTSDHTCDDIKSMKPLLNVPKNIEFHNSYYCQYDKIEQFSSKRSEREYFKRAETLGYSAAASAETGFWRIGFEVSVKSKREELTTEEAYSSTVKHCIIPLASCSFEYDQLQLSEDAISHLQKITEAMKSGEESVQAKLFDDFFQKFGSHAFIGPLHFGGKYEVKCFSSGFKPSDKELEEVQKLQREAITAQESMPKSGVTAKMKVSDIKYTFRGKYSEKIMSHTFVEVAISGVPSKVTAAGLPEWKNMLVASNSSWCLIDRGTTRIPVWDIIEKKHAIEFPDSYNLVKRLKQEWEKKNMPDQWQPHQRQPESEVSKLMVEVTNWKENADEGHVEDQLTHLAEKKESVIKTYMDPQMWPTLYLSKMPLQKFLISVTQSLKPDTSPEQSKKIKHLMRQIVEPTDVKPCPESVRIWLYGTDEPNPPVMFKDFLNLNKYFKFALQCMNDGMGNDERDMESAVLPHIGIKATAIVANAVSCFRHYLKEAKQVDEESFLITMLYPFKYDLPRDNFLSLVTKSDMEYICREFENDSKEYFDKKKCKTPLILQSYLFVLTVKLYETLDVDEAQIKCQIKCLKERIGDKLDPKVSWCLDELESKNYDWVWFKNQLDFLDHDDSINPEEGGMSLEALLVQTKVIGQGEPGVRENALQKDKTMEKFFMQVGLKEYFPQKLTLSQALEIKDFPKETSNKANDSRLYPFLILQKIMSFDYRCRIKLILSNDLPQKIYADTDPDDSDDDDDNIIHPMDGLLALLHCSDNFLRQDLMSRLATCQLAVPLLLPDPVTREPTFLLWAMRTIVKEFKADQESSPFSGPICSYAAPFVSVLRIGQHEKSKSQFLNAVINTIDPATFFHYNCDGGSAKRVLVDGLVDISWYLPSKGDHTFPNTITFANMHGNACDSKHSKQVKFLGEVSVMHLVFVNANNLNESAIKVLKCLSEAPEGMIILQTTAGTLKDELVSKNINQEKFQVVRFFRRNDTEIKIKTKVQDIIKTKVFWRKQQPLQDFNVSGIQIDENEPNCVKGKELAEEFRAIADQYKSDHPGENPKKQLVLQSSKLWHKWAAKEKEQYRQNLRGHMSPGNYSVLQRNQMGLIRKQQFVHAKSLSHLMTSFLRSLLAYKGHISMYYLQWLKLILDDHSRDLLPPLLDQYQQKIKELDAIPKRDETAEKICRQEIKELSKNLIDASFGLEHLIREIVQMYEAVISQESISKDLSEHISRLPEIAAKLLINGFSLELIDGDAAAHVPMKWVSAVLSDVSKSLNKPQILVLSVLGIQSSGKSTMLNTLFGVQFSVSAGRCTRGAFMQLVPVSKSLEKCGFQYFLIIDTEGLRSQELDARQMQKRDNELATLVVGLANVTIINIKGQTWGEMKDILQTTVHAFIRMSEVELRSKCHFVHQNVEAVTAEDKGKMGLSTVKQDLDDMTHQAAIQECLEAEYWHFSQVIEFDYEKDISYFPNLWRGRPPMAPVSTGYSDEAQILKSRLVDLAPNVKRDRDCSLLQWKQHLEELWKAVLEENFVFSFVNTYEIAAYRKLEVEYAEWSWSFKKNMLDWEQKATNALMSCSIEDLSKHYEENVKALPAHVSEKNEEELMKLNTHFEENNEQNIISKWKFDTEVRLQSLRNKLQSQAENMCKQLYKSRNSCAKAEKIKDKLREDILDRVQQLSLTMEKGTLDEEKLKEKFEESWVGWIIELTAGFERLQCPDIKTDIQKAVEEYLQTYHKTYVQKTAKPTGKPLEEWGSKLELKVVTVHLKVPKSSLSGMKSRAETESSEQIFLPSAQTDSDIILKKVEKKLEDQRSEENYNPNFPSEVLQLLFDEMSKVSTDQFFFTSTYKVEVALTACGYALRKFKTMAEAFIKKHDPFEYIENNVKDQCYTLFVDTYKEIAKERTAANTVCQQLKKAIRKRVLSLLSTNIVTKMRGTYPWIRVKMALKAKILEDIGDNLENERTGSSKPAHAFDDCALYLKNIEESLQHWIQFYTERYCDEYDLQQHNNISIIAINTLEDSIRLLKPMAMEVTRSLRESKDFRINEWLTRFHSKVMNDLQLDQKEFCALGSIQELKNGKVFTDEVVKGLDSVQSTLKDELERLTSAVMNDLGKKPYDILFDEVAGCTETCPFCKEQCELHMKNHCKDVQTKVQHTTMHRPECLGGFKWHGTGKMVLDVCTSLVGSDYKFSTKATKGEWKPFKKYTDYYPDWQINADPSLEASLYWKWLIGNFYTKIKVLFGFSETEIDEEWKKKKWDKTKAWLRVQYNVAKTDTEKGVDG